MRAHSRTGHLMNRHANVIATAAFCSAICVPSAALATGLGNLTYTQAELEKPVANFGGKARTSGPPALPAATRSSCSATCSSSWAPTTAGRRPDRSTLRREGSAASQAAQDLRRHARNVSPPRAARDAGGDDRRQGHPGHPSTTGLQFFDFTDPMNPAPVRFHRADRSQWRRLRQLRLDAFLGVALRVRRRDGQRRLHRRRHRSRAIRRGSALASGMLGNFRVGPTYAAGNYLVVANMDQGTTHFW